MGMHVFAVPHGRGSLLSGQVASTACLEPNNDICDLQISFFLQVSKDSSSEKYFTLSNPVKVWIQLQCLDLKCEREQEDAILEIGGLL